MSFVFQGERRRKEKMDNIERLKDSLNEIIRKLQWVEKKMKRMEEILRKKGVPEDKIREIMKRYDR